MTYFRKAAVVLTITGCAFLYFFVQKSDLSVEQASMPGIDADPQQKSSLPPAQEQDEVGSTNRRAGVDQHDDVQPRKDLVEKESVPVPQYKSNRVLGTLSAREVADNHNFEQLADNNGQLVIGHKTKNTIMNMFYDLPREEIEAASPRIREAAALHLDEASVAEFMVLVDEFSDYFRDLDELDSKLNQGEISMDDKALAAERRAIEDKAFGEEKAVDLFGATRALEDAAARHKERFKDQEITEADREQMMAEYEAIKAQYGIN